MGEPKRTYVGIDNGTSGGVAILETDGSIRVHKTPTMKLGDKPGEFIDDLALRRLIVEGRDPTLITAVWEFATKNPIFGTKGNWGTGWSGGVVMTVLRQNGVRTAIVSSKEWQRTMLADRGPSEDTKVASIRICHRLFPQVSLIPPGCKKEHDGIADALLMAEFGRRNRL
jgi:crossover junction endodeoxyribonuclease RuvC